MNRYLIFLVHLVNEPEEAVNLLLVGWLTMVPHAFHLSDQFVSLLHHPTLIATGDLFVDHYTLRVITPCDKRNI